MHNVDPSVRVSTTGRTTGGHDVVAGSTLPPGSREVALRDSLRLNCSLVLNAACSASGLVTMLSRVLRMARYPEGASVPKQSSSGSAEREQSSCLGCTAKRAAASHPSPETSVFEHVSHPSRSPKLKSFQRAAKLGLDLVTRCLNRKSEHCVQEHRLDCSVECEIYLFGKELSCLGKLDCSCAVIHTRFAITRLMRPSNTVICLPSSTP